MSDHPSPPYYLESSALAVHCSAVGYWTLTDQANKKKSLSCKWLGSWRRALRALGKVPRYQEFACSYCSCRKCQIASIPCSRLQRSCFFISPCYALFSKCLITDGLRVHSFSHLLFVKGEQMYCLLLCRVESLVQQLPKSSEIKTSAYGKNGMRSQFLWLR